MAGNPDANLTKKNHALFKEVKNNGKLFIFGMGGYSDTKGFMRLDQVQSFADKVAHLLGTVGDGINLDFEHISSSGNKQEQLKVMAHLLHYTRRALISARIKWKEITYTCRYNAIYNDTNRPEGFKKHDSDGELVEIAKILAEDFAGEKLTDVIQ